MPADEFGSRFSVLGLTASESFVIKNNILIAPVVPAPSSPPIIQKGDILIPANPGPPGKWPLKRRERERERERESRIANGRRRLSVAAADVQQGDNNFTVAFARWRYSLTCAANEVRLNAERYTVKGLVISVKNEKSAQRDANTARAGCRL